MTLHPPGKAPIASDAGRGISLLPRPSRLATPQSIALRPLVPVLKREAEDLSGEQSFTPTSAGFGNRAFNVFLRNRFRCQYCGDHFPSSQLAFEMHP